MAWRDAAVQVLGELYPLSLAEVSFRPRTALATCQNSRWRVPRRHMRGREEDSESDVCVEKRERER